VSDQSRYWVQAFPIPRSLNQNGIINRVLLIRSILFLFLLLLLFSLWPITWLLARDDRSEAHLGMWRIQADEAFDIIYTHSVQLSPVTERYHINKSGELILDETLFSTYGAGLPATTPYDFEITEDSFRIFNPVKNGSSRLQNRRSQGQSQAVDQRSGYPVYHFFESRSSG